VAIGLTTESAAAPAALSDTDQMLVVEGRGRKGQRAEYRCAGCGYGIVVYGQPPSCPMCREPRWEHVEWRPFSQLLDFPLADLAGSVSPSVSRLARAAPISSGKWSPPSSVAGDEEDRGVAPPAQQMRERSKTS
jgi:hypothetical protein